MNKRFPLLTYISVKWPVCDDVKKLELFRTTGMHSTHYNTSQQALDDDSRANVTKSGPNNEIDETQEKDGADTNEDVKPEHHVRYSYACSRICLVPAHTRRLQSHGI